MSTAVVLAMLATLSFASSNIFLARGAQTSATASAVRLSVYLGVPYFLIVAGSWGKIDQVPPLAAMAFFAAAGTVHFGVGRTLMWGAVRLLGASRAMLFTALSPVISLVGAAVIFDEIFPTLAIFGAGLAISGPVVVGRFRSSATLTGDQRPNWSAGVVRAVLGAMCWGTSPLFVKAGLDRGVPAQFGIVMSYTAAAAVLLAIASLSRNITPIRSIPRSAFGWFLASSFATNTAQLLMYMAYDAGDVTTVVVIVQIAPILVTLLTFLVNRDVERITPAVVVGGILAVSGSMLVVGSR